MGNKVKINVFTSVVDYCFFFLLRFANSPFNLEYVLSLAHQSKNSYFVAIFSIFIESTGSRYWVLMRFFYPPYHVCCSFCGACNLETDKK